LGIVEACLQTPQRLGFTKTVRKADDDRLGHLRLLSTTPVWRTSYREAARGLKGHAPASGYAVPDANRGCDKFAKSVELTRLGNTRVWSGEAWVSPGRAWATRLPPVCPGAPDC